MSEETIRRHIYAMRCGLCRILAHECDANCFVCLSNAEGEELIEAIKAVEKRIEEVE